MKQKLEDGDLFERTQAAWIRTNLPIYEEIWSEFIGHNGLGNPIHCYIGDDGASTNEHKMFCQSHYSTALFLYIFDTSTKDSLEYIRSHQSKPLDANVYISLTQRTSTFLALMGQICDMVAAIATALGANHIYEPIAKFMKERNQAIHAARIPMGMNYAGVYFAPIALHDSEPGYRNRIAWSEVEQGKYKYAEDWFEETRSGLISKIANEVLPHVKANCHKIFIKSQTGIRQPESYRSANHAHSTLNTPISGAMHYPRLLD
jgi:hypothetical protein